VGKRAKIGFADLTAKICDLRFGNERLSDVREKSRRTKSIINLFILDNGKTVARR